MTSQLLSAFTCTSVTLSGSNLKATQSGGSNWAWSYGSPVFNSGKWYWEVTCNNQSSSNAPGVGFGPRMPSIKQSDGNSYSGGTEGAGGVTYTQAGSIYYLGATIATGYPTFTTGSVVSFAIDYGNQNIWVRVNGGNWNGSGTANPATNTGGLSVASSLNAVSGISPSVALYYSADAMTINFGDSAFTYTVPSGFTAVTNAPTYSSIISSYQSSTQASHTYDIINGWYGDQRPWSPSATETYGSGTVAEGATLVGGKQVYLYDFYTGKLLGGQLSVAGTGAFKIPALGRAKIFAVALDPTTYQALCFDDVTPHT